ncbi:MAG TPA: hypothetical protein VGB18_08055 [Candidatus Thermoplasmatota archaeon]
MVVRLEISRGGLFSLLVGWSALTAGTTGILVRYLLDNAEKAFIGSLLIAALGIIVLGLAVFGFVKESRTD